MNDNIIINIISKTYFIIISFFIFIFSFIFIFFIILQNGLLIDEYSSSSIHIERLYIKWNNKLDLSVKELRISKEEDSAGLSSTVVQNYFTLLSQGTNYFDSVIINNLVLTDTNLSVKYRQGEDGFIKSNSSFLDFDSILSQDEDGLHLSIKHFKHLKTDTSIIGDIHYCTTSHTLSSQLDISIHEDARFCLSTSTTPTVTTYKVINKEGITNLKHLVQMIDVPKEVSYWISDAIDMSILQINRLDGSIFHNDIKNAYKNIELDATLKDLNYIYHKDLDPIHTAQTLLKFKNGILFIFPKKSFSNNVALKKSWLKIDFTEEEELLTIKLLFDGTLDKGMLDILHTYKIDLPFSQNSGLVNTDLNITVGLRNINVNAQGDFFTKKANFNYLGQEIDISHAHINLDNYNVSISGMQAQYKEIANANVNVNYNAHLSTGKVALSFNKIEHEKFILDTHLKDLAMIYNIDPSGDTLSIKESSWKFQKKLIDIEHILVNIDLDKLLLDFPIVAFSYEDIASGFLSGQVDLQDINADLDIDFLNFSYNGLKLTQSNTPIKVKYKDRLDIYSPENIYFSLSGTECMVEPFKIKADQNSASLSTKKLYVGKYASANVSAKYNTDTEVSHLSLNNFILIDPNTKKTLYKNKKIFLSLKENNSSLIVNSKELNTNLVVNELGWELSLNSLEDIKKHSPLLQTFNISDGMLTLSKKEEEEHVNFNAHIIYPYKILLQNKKPTTEYNINGTLSKETITAQINKKINIEIKDDVKINIHNSGININELIRAVKELPIKDSNSTTNITAFADNSFIYLSENRRILSQTIDVQYYNNILTAQLKHKEALGGFSLQENTFHLYGRDFNDEFISNLFNLSQFKGGSLDFSASGDLNDYKGALYLKETTITDYKILNNILAFVNTVPSLITFSLPGYSTNGLYTDTAYLRFNTKNNLIHLSDIYLDSKEVDIVGKGVVDIEKETLNIDLNLQTDLGSKLSQVPVVGYIIFDEKSISTTLNIDGNLSNPSVKSLIAKDIIVAPLNIIQRVLTLPYKLLQDVSN